MNTIHPLYNTIKKIRTSKGFTQEYVAEKLGMLQGNYTKLEAGKTQITIERLERIAEVFGMTVLELLEGHESSAQKKTDLESLERLEQRIKELESRVLELQDRIKDKESIIQNQKIIMEIQKSHGHNLPTMYVRSKGKRVPYFFKKKDDENNFDTKPDSKDDPQ